MDRDGQGLIAFKNGSIISTVTQDDGLLSNNINLLTTGEDGSIYIGTNNGLNRYFLKARGSFLILKETALRGIEAKPNAVFKSPSGDLWFWHSEWSNAFLSLRSNCPESRTADTYYEYAGEL